MNRTILELCDEHRRINLDLNQVENYLESGLWAGDQNTINNIIWIVGESFKTHHKKESEVLYPWMISQNSQSDKTIIDRINSEHLSLEKLSFETSNLLKKYTPGKSNSNNRHIENNLREFIDLYREHINHEEKFIYLIAEGILNKKGECLNM